MGVAPVLVYRKELRVAHVPDYLASLAELEAYPDTLIADITANYNEDMDGATAMVSDLTNTVSTLTLLNEQLASTNAQLIASIGVGAINEQQNNDDTNLSDDDADIERGENITLDDLMEDD